MLGALFVTSLIIPFIPRLFEDGSFGRYSMIDAFKGAGIGNIAVGQPVVCYLLGGELHSSGISLVGVTAVVMA
ncbi:hypothetical protein AU255_08030 [Methyloprofundus sedimenti]|uniref:Uncharacterized protein n=1 Tax=Methyloprofundus sedimenti TaxID=1420851 RepID=A0A1V8M8F0_9GAMM|nr:hypothetical protein AU255_08030 [Methyloprofundus sedimenti]